MPVYTLLPAVFEDYIGGLIRPEGAELSTGQPGRASEIRSRRARVMLVLVTEPRKPGDARGKPIFEIVERADLRILRGRRRGVS
jgi:hypothetical protein